MKIAFILSLLFLFSCSKAYNDGKTIGQCVCEEWEGPELIKLSDRYIFQDTTEYSKFKLAFLNYMNNNCPNKYDEYKNWIEKKKKGK